MTRLDYEQQQDEDIPEMSGECIECGRETENYVDDEWICEACDKELIRQQLEDNRLNDPRHGQAAELNRRR